MNAERLHLRADAIGKGISSLLISPERAGWSFSSLRVWRVDPGESRSFETGDDEMIVLPLSGAAHVHCEGRTFERQGRHSVWSRVSDFVYLPRETLVSLESKGGGEFALPGARARRRLAPRYGPAEAVPVEIRGAGTATRQINNFCAPDVFAADRLMAVEVLTPAGNWSSYPAHKHDEEREGEAVLEEISTSAYAGRTVSAFIALIRRMATSTPRSPFMTATSSSYLGAITDPAWPAPTTTCTISTSWPGRVRRGPWPSATIPHIITYGSYGSSAPSIPVCP